MSDGLVLLSFPARADYLILPRLALAGVARAVPMAEEVLADLKLAVTEACGNVVRHAYDETVGEPGAVHLTIAAEPDWLTITIEDDGVGLSPELLAAENGGDPSTHRESGMGLAIIAAIADELEVRRAGPAGGTQLRIRKRLA